MSYITLAVNSTPVNKYGITGKLHDWFRSYLQGRLRTVLSKPLELIVNNSFSSGIVPSDMKLANIIPVFKKGSQTCLSNYCPISLLSVFHKLLEKLTYNRLINFLENHEILFDKQFGFRSKHNTDHA